MEKRSIALSIIFTLITCGLYSFYWTYKLTNECHYALGRNNTASGGWVLFYSVITLGIYVFYWIYEMGEAVAEVKRMRGMATSGHESIIYLILTLFGVGIVSMALLQKSLNDVIEDAAASGI